MMPMYQSEALWINFSSKYLHKHRTEYPFAVKMATGKINAVTGDEWVSVMLMSGQKVESKTPIDTPYKPSVDLSKWSKMN
jgi:hypothetical protein